MRKPVIELNRKSLISKHCDRSSEAIRKPEQIAEIRWPFRFVVTALGAE